MKNNLFSIVISIFLLTFLKMYSQETLPIYTDYLTDNIYLVHTAAAGISDNGRIRLTGRKQWLDYSNAPELQTLSFNTHFGQQSAIGMILFNDKNGHFSQAGGYLTYAYHLQLDDYYTNQLSFGLSLVASRNALDGSDFNLQDSDVSNQIESVGYYNADVGMAYRYENFFSLYTIKNILMSDQKLFDNHFESTNLRHHLVTIGYHYNENEELVNIQFSTLAQYIEKTNEVFLDSNIKAFFPFYNGEFYGGLSYRKNFHTEAIEQTNYFTPFVGVKYKDFIFSYSYTLQQGNNLFSTGAFHQITLGYNFFIERSIARKASWDL